MVTKNDDYIIFDLDDTLYNELDYLKSAFFDIANCISKKTDVNRALIFDKMLSYYFDNQNVFNEIIKFSRVSIAIPDLLSIYRNHIPNIKLLDHRKGILDSLKSNGYKIGLLTDGRSKQQRNKIKALNIEHYFESIVISEEFGSEKPSKTNYLHFETLFGEGNYFYIGDNISKDFLSPNKLGWTSICILDNGNNIHKQNFNLEQDYLPKITIKDFSSLGELFKLH